MKKKMRRKQDGGSFGIQRHLVGIQKDHCIRCFNPPRTRRGRNDSTRVDCTEGVGFILLHSCLTLLVRGALIEVFSPSLLSPFSHSFPLLPFSLSFSLNPSVTNLSLPLLHLSSQPPSSISFRSLLINHPLIHTLSYSIFFFLSLSLEKYTKRERKTKKE